jgi:hypothetical protein
MVCVKIKLYIYLASLSLISQWFCSCFKVEEERRRLDPVLRILDESIANARGVRRTGPPEPSMFDDDEPLGRFQSINFAATVYPFILGVGDIQVIEKIALRLFNSTMKHEAKLKLKYPKMLEFCTMNLYCFN